MLQYLPLELRDEAGTGTGRWRFHLLRPQKDPMPLCRCVNGHPDQEKARRCYDVQRSLPRAMRQPDLEPDRL